MFRSARLIVLVIAAAVGGAIAGRIASDLRAAIEAGDEPSIDPAAVEVRPRDVVPGLLVALRSADRPWSYLHVPAWLIAFAVNFALGAFGSELAPLRRAAGIDLFDGNPEEPPRRPEDASTSTPLAPVWTTEAAPRTGANTPEATSRTEASEPPAPAPEEPWTARD